MKEGRKGSRDEGSTSTARATRQRTSQRRSMAGMAIIARVSTVSCSDIDSVSSTRAWDSLGRPLRNP